MSRIFAKLHKSSEGSVVILVAVMLALIFAILAVSVDLSRTQSGSINNKNAVDASALAVAEMIMKGKYERIGKEGYEGTKWMEWQPGSKEIEDYAMAAYKQNLLGDQSDTVLKDSQGNDAEFTVTISPFTDNHSTVKIKACPFVTPTIFADIRGSGKDQKVCTQSQAGFTIESKPARAEIAFSLDFTGSMIDNNKMGALNNAMQNIFTEYFKADSEFYASITPFTTMVSIYPYNTNFVEGAPAPAPYGINNIPQFQPLYDTNHADTGARIDEMITVTLDKLNAFDGTAHIKFQNFNQIRDGFNSHFPLNMKIDNIRVDPIGTVQPLTNDPVLLSKYLEEANVKVSGSTSGKPGGRLQWFENNNTATTGTSSLSGFYVAWLTIAQSSKGLWNAQSYFERAGDGGKGFPTIDRSQMPSLPSESPKYLIHITDGIDNPEGMSTDNFPFTDNSVVDNNPYYKTMCDKIKANDIKIYVIVYGASAKQYIKDCASAPENVFDNVTPQEINQRLAQIFAGIKLEATAVRLEQ